MILRFGALAASWKRQDGANVGRDGANMVPGWCTGGQDDVNLNQDGIKVHENGAYEAPNVVQQSDLEIDPTWLKQDFFQDGDQ